MKKVEVNVFTINELSPIVKEKAIEKYRDEIDNFAWQDENRESMEKFAEIFPIKIRNWSYGGRGEGVQFYFESEDYIEELSGQRLATYLWNNYKNDLWKGKYMGSLKTNDYVKHNRIKSPVKVNSVGNRHNPYYSAITLDNSCVLTGYCMDDDLTDNIYSFINKPDDRNFRDLLEDCFDAWVTACNRDIEWQQSDEYIIEQIENSEMEFDECGKRFLSCAS